MTPPFPLPADGLDPAAWAGLVAATAFVLALRWAIGFTAPRGADDEERLESDR